MKQNMGPIAIVIAVVAVLAVGFLIYSMTSNSATAGYTAPPADADARAKQQKMGEEYGKKMEEQMRNRYQGGRQGNAPPR